jgi:hypothetical protein
VFCKWPVSGRYLRFILFYFCKQNSHGNHGIRRKAMQLLGYVAREQEDALTGPLRDGPLLALLGSHLTGRDPGAQTAALSTLCDLAHHPSALLAMKQVGFFFSSVLVLLVGLSLSPLWASWHTHVIALYLCLRPGPPSVSLACNETGGRCCSSSSRLPCPLSCPFRLLRVRCAAGCAIAKRCLQ